MAHIAILPILLLLMTFGNTINAGITRQLDQMLPNKERITRSVPSYPIEVEEDPKSLETLETMPTEDETASKHQQRLDRPVRSANNYDLNTAENNVVFKPLFRKRPNGNRLRVRRSAQNDLADLQPAENNIVFKPVFRKRVNSNANRRVARGAPNAEAMETAENNVVFKPIFRRNHQNIRNLRRSRRSAGTNLDDMQTAENNIVFKPLFRRRQPVRRVRSADNDLQIAESQYAAYYENGENVKKDEINSDEESNSDELNLATTVNPEFEHEDKSEQSHEDKDDKVEDECIEETATVDEVTETSQQTRGKRSCITFRPKFAKVKRGMKQD